MKDHNELHQHEYRRSLSMRISNAGAIVISGLAVWIALPNDTNLLLTFICVLSVVVSVDRLHFELIERPIVHQWMIDHTNKYHKEEYEKFKESLGIDDNDKT